MNLIIIPLLYIVVVVNVVLSVIILTRGIKQASNLLFGLIAFAVAIWSFAIIGFYTDSLKFLFNWIALTHSSALFSALVLLFFSISFPRKIAYHKIITSITLISFLTTVYYLFFTEEIVGETTGISYTINHGYLFYQIILVIYFFLSYIALFMQYRNAQNEETKQQVKLIFIGSLFASLFGMITNLILPALNIFQYTWLGPIFTLALVASIFIAILKYRLFNIRIIITELLSIVLIVALSIEIFLEVQPILLLIKTVVLILIVILSYFLIRSVVQEVELREKVEKQEKDLEKANEQQTTLIHFISHEIKGFLAKSRNIFSLILEEDYGPMPEYLKVPAQEGLESGTKGVGMVQEILSAANLKKGTIQYLMEDFDIKPLVEKIVSDLRSNAEAKDLKLELIISQETDFTMHGDSEQLSHTFKNLIDNSIKYTLEGGLTVSLTKDSGKIIFSVKDTGVGINEEDRRRLFTEGGNGKNSLKINVDSTGYGLYIAKKIVEAHSGKIWLESDGEGKGSVFFVELPMKI